MDLDTIEIEIGEFIYVNGIYMYRNEHAYLVFKRIDSDEFFGSVLYFNEQYFSVETLLDLRSYKVEDFI